MPVISSITNGTGLEGQSANVTLVVDANPQIVAGDVSVSLSNTPTIQISGDTVTLTFSNLMRSNDGQHIVNVTNSEGLDTEYFTIAVYCKWKLISNLLCFVVGPTFVQTGGTETVLVGGSITLDCSIQESNPLATVTYTTTATTTNNVVFNSSTNMIIISNVVTGNSGEYTCTADSGKATATLVYTLDVNSK